MIADARKILRRKHLVSTLVRHLSNGHDPGIMKEAPRLGWKPPKGLEAYQVDVNLGEDGNIYVLAYMFGVCTESKSAHMGLQLLATRYAACCVMDIHRHPTHIMSIIDGSIHIITHPRTIMEDGTQVCPQTPTGYFFDESYSPDLAEFFALMCGRNIQPITELGLETKVAMVMC